MLIIRSFSLQENFMNNESDPDVNFYQNNISNVEANYFLMTEVKEKKAMKQLLKLGINNDYTTSNLLNYIFQSLTD